MKHSFLRHIGIAACALAAAFNLAADPIPDAYKQNGFAVGAQAYTFNRFSVFEAIEKTAEAGGKERPAEVRPIEGNAKTIRRPVEAEGLLQPLAKLTLPASSRHLCCHQL